MGRFDETDLKLTADGDLSIKNGDFELVHNAEATAQNAYCRLKSADPEWYGEQICASLEDLLGMENKAETAAFGEQRIRDSLTKDSLINSDELYVQGTPVDKSTILFFVYFNVSDEIEPIGFEVSVNLSSGIALRRAA